MANIDDATIRCVWLDLSHVHYTESVPATVCAPDASGNIVEMDCVYIHENTFYVNPAHRPALEEVATEVGLTISDESE